MTLTEPRRLLARAFLPVDGAFLAAFRILFGIAMLYGVVRFLANGWVAMHFVEPKFHFKYWGFEWVQAWPAWGMYLHFAVLGVLATLIAVGLFYRVAIALFFVGFTYLELIDVSMYLNHYYLVSLLALLLVFLPAHRVLSLDASRKPEIAQSTVPAYHLYLLRLQIGVVYFFAGLAKLQGDWLLHAQPLNIWLNARTDFPLIGSLFTEPWMAFAFSWAGFLFDTTIPLWLSLRKTRTFAFVVVIAFHCVTGALFQIGLFPLIMVLSALVFFPPDWPRGVARRLGSVLPVRSGWLSRFAMARPEPAAVPAFPAARWGLALALVYGAAQVLIPLRHQLYSGDVLWHEQGMRYSWKVMVRAKTASVTYLVYSPKRDRTFHVSPTRYLTALQEREMATQPDLILQLGQKIAADFRARGHGDVQVRAEVLASLNGRRAARLVDPSVDLTRVEDGLAEAGWIVREPMGEPARLAPRKPALAALGARLGE